MAQEISQAPNQLREPSNTPDLPRVIRTPIEASFFQHCTLLESLSVLAYESHQSSIFETKLADKCQELLIEWYNSYHQSNCPHTVWTSPLMILWHATFVMLYANLDLLERACGRDGGDIDPEAITYAQQWAQTDESKRCLVHTGFIQKAFRSMSLGDVSPIHVPLCLYHCGIIWFCFGKFGGRFEAVTQDAESLLQFPEFRLLGSSGKQNLGGDHGYFRSGWDMTEQVFRFIDLLQRVPHWKLPLNLASTLLALMEDKNIF